MSAPFVTVSHISTGAGTRTVDPKKLLLLSLFAYAKTAEAQQKIQQFEAAATSSPYKSQSLSFSPAVQRSHVVEPGWERVCESHLNETGHQVISKGQVRLNLPGRNNTIDAQCTVVSLGNAPATDKATDSVPRPYGSSTSNVLASQYKDLQGRSVSPLYYFNKDPESMSEDEAQRSLEVMSAVLGLQYYDLGVQYYSITDQQGKTKMIAAPTLTSQDVEQMKQQLDQYDNDLWNLVPRGRHLQEIGVGYAARGTTVTIDEDEYLLIRGLAVDYVIQSAINGRRMKNAMQWKYVYVTRLTQLMDKEVRKHLNNYVQEYKDSQYRQLPAGARHLNWGIKWELYEFLDPYTQFVYDKYFLCGATISSLQVNDRGALVGDDAVDAAINDFNTMITSALSGSMEITLLQKPQHEFKDLLASIKRSELESAASSAETAVKAVFKRQGRASPVLYTNKEGIWAYYLATFRIMLGHIRGSTHHADDEVMKLMTNAFDDGFRPQ